MNCICKMLMNFYWYAEILKPHLNIINPWLKQIALCIEILNFVSWSKLEIPYILYDIIKERDYN